MSEGIVFASKAARTRFKITSRAVSPGEVILPEDKVSIKAIVGEQLDELDVLWRPDNSLVADSGAGRGGSVPRGPPGYQHPGWSVGDFTFSDFKRNFLSAGKNAEEADAKVSWLDDYGEEWELCT